MPFDDVNVVNKPEIPKGVVDDVMLAYQVAQGASNDTCFLAALGLDLLEPLNHSRDAWEVGGACGSIQVVGILCQRLSNLWLESLWPVSKLVPELFYVLEFCGGEIGSYRFPAQEFSNL